MMVDVLSFIIKEVNKHKNKAVKIKNSNNVLENWLKIDLIIRLNIFLQHPVEKSTGLSIK